MIQQLEEEASADADKKQYCDKELGDAGKKKADRADTVDDISTKIDQMLARSKHLKKQVVNVEAFLAKTAAAQSEMDKLRQEEHAEYLQEKSELDEGLDGVRSALKVLNDYYGGDDKGHKADSSAASNILSLLETIESDFSKSLAELQGSEEMSQADYEKETQDNSVIKSAREAEVKARTKEFTSLDKGVADLKSDLSGVQNELTAVSDYLAKLKGECVFDKVESYAEQKEKREAEIAGLKEALSTLEKETAFFQVSLQRRRQRRQQHFLG
jgi:regulator of replication initiation timing